MTQPEMGAAEASQEVISGLEAILKEPERRPIRLFAAARADTPEQISELKDKPDLKAEEININWDKTPEYDPVLSSDSINERERYWQDPSRINLSFDDKLERWKGTFARLVSSPETERDPNKTSAIRSILTEGIQQKYSENFLDFSPDDAKDLYDVYSADRKSNIDVFMGNALKDLKEGNINLETFEARLNGLEWVAAGFFGEKTAADIRKQLLLEANFLNKSDDTRGLIEKAFQPEAEEAAQPEQGVPAEEGDELHAAPLPAQELAPAPTPRPDEDDYEEEGRADESVVQPSEEASASQDQTEGASSQAQEDSASDAQGEPQNPSEEPAAQDAETRPTEDQSISQDGSQTRARREILSGDPMGPVSRHEENTTPQDTAASVTAAEGEEKPKDEQPSDQPPEQNIPRPRITENDLEGKIDYKLLSESIEGIDMTAETKGRVETLLDNINLNAAFLDPDKTREMTKVVDNHIERVIRREDQSDRDIAEKEAARLLREFLFRAQTGLKRAALSTLESAAQEAQQHSIVDARERLVVSLNGENHSLGNIAYSFFELSEMMYASAHEGQRYQSPEKRKEIEELRRKNEDVNIT